MCICYNEYAIYYVVQWMTLIIIVFSCRKEMTTGMNIGIIAHNSKKSLIEDFCIAYKGILARHEIYATGTTGRMIERNDMDMVIFFYNSAITEPREPDVAKIVRACDQYNIPVATNIATAEMLILGLDRGDLDWRIQYKEDM